MKSVNNETVFDLNIKKFFPPRFPTSFQTSLNENLDLFDLSVFYIWFIWFYF